MSGRVVRQEAVHYCDLPKSVGVDYDEGTVWECDTCLRRWRVYTTPVHGSLSWEPLVPDMAWWRRLRRRMTRKLTEANDE